MHLPAETRLKAIIDGTRAGTWEWNLRTHAVIFNERWASMLGYTLAELSPIDFATWQDLTHPEDRALAEQELKLYLKGQRPAFDCKVRMRHRDGQWRWVHTRGKRLSEGGSNDDWIFGTHIDVTEEQESRLRLQTLAESLPGIIYSFAVEPSGAFHFTYVSDKCRDFYGLSPQEIVEDASLVFDLIFPDDLEIVNRSIAESHASLQEWRCQYRLAVNGDIRWFEGVAQPNREPEGRVVWHGMVMDITERKALELELERLSVTDALTGLYNRRHLMRCLEDHAASGQRYGTGFALVFIDIDHFKAINDAWGHPVGDRVLKQFASLLSGRARRTDVVARTGGEEFVLLMPAANEEEAGQVAEALRMRARQERYSADEGSTLQVTFSAGVAAWSPDLTLQELLSTCDQCLYRAKRSGRDQVVVARPAPDQ